MKRTRREEIRTKPIELVLFQITKYFTIDDLLNLSMVSRSFNQISSQDSIWKHIYTQIIRRSDGLFNPRHITWKNAVREIFFTYFYPSMKTKYAEKMEILSIKYNIERDMNILKGIENLKTIEEHKFNLKTALKRKKYNDDIKICFGNIAFLSVETQNVNSEDGTSTSYSSRYELTGKSPLVFEFSGFESDFVELSFKFTCSQNNQVFATLASINEDKETIHVDTRAVNYVQDILFLNHLKIPDIISFLLICGCPINLGSFENIQKTYN